MLEMTWFSPSTKDHEQISIADVDRSVNTSNRELRNRQGFPGKPGNFGILFFSPSRPARQSGNYLRKVCEPLSYLDRALVNTGSNSKTAVEINMIKPEFLLASLVVVLIPGTGVVYTITTGLTLKWRASLAAALGCTLGIVPHILASILGLSALLNMSAQFFSVLKLAGALYLLYLAWNMWREAGTLDIDHKNTETGAIKIILKAIAINLLNPKLTIFFFAFLPLFVSKSTTSPTVQMLMLSAVFMGITLIVFALYGILASGVSAYLVNSSTTVKRVQRTFALILAGFAVKLALSEK
jgi:threonine/homoserine/homoserine lactone efflux protein